MVDAPKIDNGSPAKNLLNHDAFPHISLAVREMSGLGVAIATTSAVPVIRKEQVRLEIITTSASFDSYASPLPKRKSCLRRTISAPNLTSCWTSGDRKHGASFKLPNLNLALVPLYPDVMRLESMSTTPEPDGDQQTSSNGGGPKENGEVKRKRKHSRSVWFKMPPMVIEQFYPTPRNKPEGICGLSFLLVLELFLSSSVISCALNILQAMPDSPDATAFQMLNITRTQVYAAGVSGVTSGVLEILAATIAAKVIADSWERCETCSSIFSLHFAAIKYTACVLMGLCSVCSGVVAILTAMVSFAGDALKAPSAVQSSGYYEPAGNIASASVNLTAAGQSEEYQPKPRNDVVDRISLSCQIACAVAAINVLIATTTAWKLTTFRTRRKRRRAQKWRSLDSASTTTLESTVDNEAADVEEAMPADEAAAADMPKKEVEEKDHVVVEE